ncbi:hypothetical protein M1307_01400 [Patescibacteria group bacterium]|nr:hypothetical protein [Patescibacteria group bacterium]
MFKSKRKVLLPVLAFVFLGIFFAWSGILNYLNLFSQEKKPSSENGETSILTNAPSDLPEGLPEDFPIFEGSEFVSSSQSENKKGVSFIWEATESPSLVYEYLKSELKIRGWTVTDNSGSFLVSSFKNEENEGFLGVFRGDGDKTVISVTIRKP